MAKSQPITLWCQQCQTGYASTGERPSICPECRQAPDWTLTPPYLLSKNDKTFLKMMRICPEDDDRRRRQRRHDDQDDGA